MKKYLEQEDVNSLFAVDGLGFVTHVAEGGGCLAQFAAGRDVAAQRAADMKQRLYRLQGATEPTHACARPSTLFGRSYRNRNLIPLKKKCF